VLTLRSVSTQATTPPANSSSSKKNVRQNRLSATFFWVKGFSRKDNPPP